MRVSCGHRSHGGRVCCAIAKAARISVSRAEPIGRCGIPCRWIHVCVVRNAESQIFCGACAVMKDWLGRAGGKRGRGEPMQRLVAAGARYRVWGTDRRDGGCRTLHDERSIWLPDLDRSLSSILVSASSQLGSSTHPHHGLIFGGAYGISCAPAARDSRPRKSISKAVSSYSFRHGTERDVRLCGWNCVHYVAIASGHGPPRTFTRRCMSDKQFVTAILIL